MHLDRPRYSVALLILAASGASGCSGFVPIHPSSGKTSRESTILLVRDLHELAPSGDSSEGAGTSPGKPTDARPATSIDASVEKVDVIEASLETPHSAWIATYGATSAHRLYDKEGSAGLYGFTLLRATDGAFAAAVDFSVEDGGADGLLITFNNIVVGLAKARVRDASWRTKWWSRALLYGLVVYDLPQLLGFDAYGDAALDVIVRVDIESCWQDEAGVAHRTSAVGGPLEWRIENIGLDDVATSFAALEGLPDPNGPPRTPRELLLPDNPESYDEPWSSLTFDRCVVHTVRQSAWVPRLPGSHGVVPVPSFIGGVTGAYTLRVTVVEADEVGDILELAASWR